MRLSIDRRTLADALGALSGLAGKKAPWNYVHMAATKTDLADELELAVSSELDTLTQSLECEVEQEGRLIVPLAALLALAEAEPGPSLSLKADRGHMKVQGGSVKGSVATGDPDTFPTLFRPPEEGWIDLPRAPLWEAIERGMSLAGTEHGASTQGLDGVLVREAGGLCEVLSWHGWRATLEALESASGVDFRAVVTHGNWSNLRQFDFPTVGLLITGTHSLWRQPGAILMCRRNEEQDKKWPTADHKGMALLRQPAEGGLTIAEEEALRLLAAKKALDQCAGVPLLVGWDGRRLRLSRENDVNAADIQLQKSQDIEPWEFKTKDPDGLFGCFALGSKSKQPVVLSPWEYGLRVVVDGLTVSLAPYGG